MVLFGFGIPYRSIRDEAMEDTLLLFRVADLKEVIDRLTIPVKKSGKKNDIVDRIVTFVRANPEWVVSRLSLDELEVTKRLLDGEKIVCDPDVATTFYWLVQLGLIRLWDVKGQEGVCKLVLAAEAEVLLGDLVKNYVITLSHRIHQLVRRWSALCGTLPLGEIVDHLKTFPGYENVTVNLVENSIRLFGEDYCIRYEQVFNKGCGDSVYITPWCFVTGAIGDLLYKEEKIDGKTRIVNAYNPVRFSQEDIMAVGLPLFAPLTPNRTQTEALIRECQRLGLPQEIAQLQLLNLWCDKQLDDTGRCIDKMLAGVRLTSMEDVNNLVGLCTDYLNTVPFWRFLGKSSSEEMRDNPIDLTRKPRLTAGPHMRAAGLDITPEMERMFEQMMRETELASGMPDGRWPVGKKVGRNDPCPCGSGKKFKNCCGR